MRADARAYLERAKNGEIDFAEFARKFYEKAKKLNERYGFFITLNDFERFASVKFEEKLFGLPVSIKDNICTKDMRTTAGSNILRDYVPPFDATCVEKIKEANASIIGKTAMDEFGFGSFTTNCAFVTPKNPWDESRTCGGSSGGAAGFVAAMDMPTVALAESTGGSISCPASFCGVVGLTPTYGLVSRWGLIDYACSLDKIGCIGKSVYDVALVLSVIACHDERDSTSLNIEQRDYTKHLDEAPRKIKAAIPKEYTENLNPKVERAFWDAVDKLEREGFLCRKVSLPHTKYALASYYIIACSEASTNLAKFCGIRYGLELEFSEENFERYFSRVRSEGFGEEAKRRIILGTFARMAGYRNKYYLKAMRIRTLIINEFKRVMKNFDCILSPTMPILPPRFEEIEKLSPLEAYRCDVLTTPVNLAGLPHLSLPCGFATEHDSKLPVGMHVICDHLEEEKLLKISRSIEKILGWEYGPEA